MKKKLPYILPVLCGLALLPIPLLRDLHFESAMLAGTIGCFWAGIRSASSFKDDISETLRILGLICLAALPLLIFALIAGCLTLDGIGFWVLIPVPSIFFGTAVGRLIRKLRLPFPKLLTTLLLLFCALGIWMIEFFSFPQVYFYNHVWGLWPGPIYDESVTLTGSFLYFRGLTLLWILLLWKLPEWKQNHLSKLVIGLSAVVLLLGYLNLDNAGIVSPNESIQEELGGHHQTKHFELFYDAGFYTEDEIAYWAARHEFHFQQITQILDIDWPEDRKVESYLYAHAWQKKKITGAKFTSYVPIWLEQDQLHIAKQQLERVLKHEMVHAISKQFGNRLFNGSWSIGLIEGLAEGIAKDASTRSTLHQIVAAEQPLPSEEDMQSALSFWGFYGSAGAISYTTTGSFVEYLLHAYPPQFLKQVYAGADFELTYQRSFEDLVQEWHQTLTNTPVDSVDQQISEFIFAQRSLFQKECPHTITTEMQLWDDYHFHLANTDTAQAHAVLDDLYLTAPKNDLVQDEWVRVQLQQGSFNEAASAITPKDSLLTLQVLKTDALFLSQGFSTADSMLQSLAPDIQASEARNFRYTLGLREDSVQWNFHIQRRFKEHFPDSISLQQQNLPNKMLALNKALQQNRSKLIKTYSSYLNTRDFHANWFDIYETTIHKLAWMGDIEKAEIWISSLEELPLRDRYRERVEEQKEWLIFTQHD